MSARRRSQRAALVRTPGSRPPENLERRTLLSGYTATAVAPLPALTTTFVNSQVSSLVRDAAGNLYGVDPQGGPGDYGSVFEVNPTTAAVSVLYTFDGTAGAFPVSTLAIDPAGDLFGLTQYSTATGSGAASSPSGPGLLFELPVGNRGGALRLYTFPGSNDTSTTGTDPRALLTDASANVFVMTTYGAANTGGAIVEFPAAADYAAPTLLGALPLNFRATPYYLTRAGDGTFYGTTVGGGDAANDGTLFRLPPGSSTVTTVATFDRATTGSGPGAPYVDAAGNVFGTVATGTPSSYGGVWEFAAATGTLSTVASASPATGIQPVGSLAADGSGNLLGITSQGGTGGGGTVFSVDPAAGTFTTAAALGGVTTGAQPAGGLVADGAGNFYGTTNVGGTNGRGAVFKLSPASGTTPTPTPTPTPTGTSTVTPTAGKTTLPTSVVSGTSAKGTVTVTLTNGGATTAAGTDTVALYASTTGVVDAASTRITGVGKKLTLKAGRSAKVALAVKNLALPAGGYTILAQVTDPAGGTSAVAVGSLAVAAAHVELTGVVGKVAPLALTPGKTLSFTLTLSNGGNVNATGRATLAIFLSSDGTALTIPVMTLIKGLTIKPGRAVAVRLKVKVPAAAAAGNFFPLVTVDQAGHTALAPSPTTVAVG